MDGSSPGRNGKMSSEYLIFKNHQKWIISMLNQRENPFSKIVQIPLFTPSLVSGNIWIINIPNIPIINILARQVVRAARCCRCLSSSTRGSWRRPTSGGRSPAGSSTRRMSRTEASGGANPSSPPPHSPSSRIFANNFRLAASSWNLTGKTSRKLLVRIIRHSLLGQSMAM